jgi:hypothetical protein
MFSPPLSTHRGDGEGAGGQVGEGRRAHRVVGLLGVFRGHHLQARGPDRDRNALIAGHGEQLAVLVSSSTWMAYCWRRRSDLPAATAFEGHGEVADHQEQGPDRHRLAGAEEPVAIRPPITGIR